jgi:hypothetical protein
MDERREVGDIEPVSPCQYHPDSKLSGEAALLYSTRMDGAGGEVCDGVGDDAVSMKQRSRRRHGGGGGEMKDMQVTAYFGRECMRYQRLDS